MNRLLGVLLIVISAASFGTLAIFGRYAYAANVDIFTLLFLRFTLAAIFMFLVLAFRREPLPRGRVLIQLIGMGALGYVGQSYTYLTAVKYASAGLVALLLYLYPMLVAILSAIFLKEKFTRTKIAALILATLGAALTANPEGGTWKGILLAIAAAAIYSIYIIVGSGVMKQVSAFQSSAVVFASAGAVYGALTAFSGAQFPQTGAGWGAVGAIIVVATIIPVSTFLGGLKLVGPTKASMLSTLEPMVTILLAGILFDEIPSPVILLGGGMILAAVVILTHEEVRRRRNSS